MNEISTMKEYLCGVSWEYYFYMIRITRRYSFFYFAYFFFRLLSFISLRNLNFKRKNKIVAFVIRVFDTLYQHYVLINMLIYLPTKLRCYIAMLHKSMEFLFLMKCFCFSFEGIKKCIYIYTMKINLLFRLTVDK